MKKYLALIFALVLFLVPSKAMAATYDVELADFADAVAAPGVETAKGMLYDDGNDVIVLGSNTYKLTEDIDLSAVCGMVTLADSADTNTVLDLNGKTINTLFDYNKGTLTITGNGTIDNLYALVLSGTANAIIENGTFTGFVGANDQSTMTIKNGTFNELFEVNEQATVVIENATFANETNDYNNNLNIFNEAQVVIKKGTFDKLIFVNGNNTETPVLTIENGKFNQAITVVYGKLTINDGTFYSYADPANSIWGNDNIYANDGAEVVINGGKFTSPYSGIIAEEANGENAKSVTINGGSFEGTDESEGLGIAMMDVDKVVIKKGTFKGKVAAIVTSGTDETKFATFLAEGSAYSPAVESQVLYSMFVGTQKEISVIIENQEYTIIDGDGQTYEDGKDIVIKADGDLADLTAIKMDNEVITGDDKMALEQGSTILTLKAAYLATLSEGSHTVTFVYDNGSVDATLTIPTKAAAEANPSTLDNITSYIIIATISGLGLVGTMALTKKRNA